MLLEARHISVSIARPPAEVYRFVGKYENLPRWAAGLSGSIAQVDGEWIAESPMGRVKVRFAPENTFGVLDHDVTILETGEATHNAMRVIPNGTGSEVVFTLLRQPGVSDEQLARDQAFIEQDLATLERLLEAR